MGRHTLRLHEVLAARGIESRIYVETVDPETEAETSLFPRYADQAKPVASAEGMNHSADPRCRCETSGHR